MSRSGHGGGLVFATDNAANEQIRHGVRLADKREPSYNNINFTMFQDLLPFMEGVRDPGPAARAAAADLFSSAMCSARSSTRWASPTPRARRSAMPAPQFG